MEIEADNVGGLGREVRVGAHAPGALPLQADAFLAQEPPNGVVADPPLRRQGGSVPSRLSCWRRFLQGGQDALAKGLVVGAGLAGAGLVAQAGQTRKGKPPPPFAHHRNADGQFQADLIVGLALRRRQHNPQTQALALGRTAGRRQRLDLLLQFF